MTGAAPGLGALDSSASPPPRRNIRLLIAYDGTDFSGWQRQSAAPGGQSAAGPPGKARRTVQGTLEDALAAIHGHQVPLTGSGRTDAGVHAVGQVANFYTSIGRIPAERFAPALNSLLPRDLRVLEARETSQDFHARFDARSRTYRYHLICRRPALPQELRYALYLNRRPRIQKLNDYSRLLLGERDCSLFAGPRDHSKTRFRHISRCHFWVRGDTLVFEITANAFLWKMVRSIVGTLLQFEEKDKDPQSLLHALSSGDHRLAGPTLPGQGLFLWHIEYYRN